MNQQKSTFHLLQVLIMHILCDLCYIAAFFLSNIIVLMVIQWTLWKLRLLSWFWWFYWAISCFVVLAKYVKPRPCCLDSAQHLDLKDNKVWCCLFVMVICVELTWLDRQTYRKVEKSQLFFSGCLFLFRVCSFMRQVSLLPMHVAHGECGVM